jgi:hypothetical protein
MKCHPAGIHLGIVAVLACAGLGYRSDAHAQTPAETQHTAALLKRNTQRLLDAVAPGDVAVWDELLDPAALQVDENDVVRDKAQILQDLKPLGAGLVGSLAVDDFRVVQKGTVAIVTHEDNERLDYHGQLLLSRFRWTDTWVKTPKGWRLLASQVLAVQKDPPAAPFSAAAGCEYAGTYALTDEIRVMIRCDAAELIVTRTGHPDRQFRSELKDVFFEPGEPRTRRIFLRDPAGQSLTGFVDRREGRDIFWKRLSG